MKPLALVAIVLCTLVVATGVSAAEGTPEKGAANSAATVQDKSAANGPRVRLYLGDGSILSGTLVERQVRIDTPLGQLDVAAEKIRSLTPTIARRARRATRIAELIRDLGTEKFADRERAQRELAEMGSDARDLLEAAAGADDAADDAERAARAKALLARLGPRPRDADEAKDVIEAGGDVVLRGRLLTKRLSLKTPYGVVAADLADIDLLGPATAGEPVDLLTVIDPQRDSIGPRWTFDEATKTLTTDPAKFARLQVPLDVPDAYELELVVTPKVGRDVRGRVMPDTLMVGIVVDGHSCQVALNSFTALGRGTFSGLEQIGGKRVLDLVSHKGEVLAMGRAATIRCRVQPGRVQCDCDDTRIVKWQGDSAELSIHPAWLLRRPKSLWLGSYLTSYEISRYVLTPLHREPLLPKLPAGNVVLRLRDGQRIVGAAHEWPVLTSEGERGRRFSLAEVSAAQITHKGTKVSATLRDEVTATAALVGNSLQVIRDATTFTVPLTDVVDIAGASRSRAR